MIRLLLATPIPSHPQDQGNSARIFALGRLLQRAGAEVHLLYHALEGLSAAQAQAMGECWDRLHVVRVGRPVPPPRPDGTYLLDDWFDPAVAVAAAALHARYRYRAVICNYVWFSAVLEAMPGAVLKILDTHDVFGGRGEMFRAAGLEAAWYRTTAAEEARGLARADIVLAIQDEEAAVFRARGHRDVRVLGHVPPWRRRTVRAGDAPVIGYMASANPINAASFAALRAVLPASGVAGARLILAGALCEIVSAAPFTPVGRIAQASGFYDLVDVVVNPMAFGTGLKIKSVEALFQGMPLVATRTAMAGLPALHDLHALDDAAAVAAALPAVARSLALRRALAAASVAAAAAYARQTMADFEALWRAVAERPAAVPSQ